MSWTLPERQRRFLGRSLLLALAVRVGLLGVALLSGRVLIESYEPSSDLLARVLTQWDAAAFLRIAEHGYAGAGTEPGLLGYYPLYPLVVRAAHLAIPSWVVAGLVASLLAAVAAGWLLQALVGLDADDDTAARALVSCFLFPTAYFLVLPYSEALFLACTLAAFLAARQGRWLSCGVAGMLACATRRQGLLLLPALALEALLRERRRVVPRALGLLLLPLGLLPMLAMMWQTRGGPGEFRGQLLNRFVGPAHPGGSLRSGLWALSDLPPSFYRTQVFEARFVALAVALLLLVAGWRRWRASYRLYAALSLALLVLDAWPLSLPRYLLGVFPLYIAQAEVGRKVAVHLALVAASALLMGGLFSVWAAGRFAY